MLWEKIGPAYCINLRSRKDRLKQAQKVFKKIGLDVSFHIVDKHPNGGSQGCFESHIQIITEAYNKGYERCIIFEDDATPTSKLNNGLLRKCIKFMNKNKDWNIFYLGVLPEIRNHSTKHITDNIYKLSGICTHAYVIHRRLMEKLINMKYIGITIDYLFIQLDSCYAVYPTLFYQGLSDSDITTNKIYSSIKNKNIIELYYNIQEKYAYYIGTPLISLKMIIFIILSFLFYIKTKNCGYSFIFFTSILYLF